MFVSAHQHSLPFVHVAIVQDEMKSRCRKPSPRGLFDVKWCGLCLSSSFQNPPFFFAFSLPYRTTVKCEDFGARQNLISCGYRLWASFVTSLSLSLCVHVMGMIILALPGVGIQRRILCRVSGSALSWLTDLPSQLSYHRGRGSALTTGDLPSLGS